MKEIKTDIGTMNVDEDKILELKDAAKDFNKYFEKVLSEGVHVISKDNVPKVALMSYTDFESIVDVLTGLKDTIDFIEQEECKSEIKKSEAKGGKYYTIDEAFEGMN